MNELTPIILDHIRRIVALQLWNLGAVKVNLTQPYKLVAGNYSPIYINCRQLISSTAFADLFAAAARIICDTQQVQFDMVAGGETAGIPFAAFLARSFGKPMVYVRKEAKGHGIASLVEGSLPPGTQTLLVEDLITDAGSKIHFLKAITAAGGSISEVLVVFDRLQGGREVLASMNIRLLAITDMDTVLSVAESAGVLGSIELAAVKRYLESPSDWHAERNLEYIT